MPMKVPVPELAALFCRKSRYYWAGLSPIAFVSLETARSGLITVVGVVHAFLSEIYPICQPVVPRTRCYRSAYD